MRRAVAVVAVALVASSSALNLRSSARSMLGIREVDRSEFGRSVLLSISEKVSAGAPSEEIMQMLDTIEGAIKQQQEQELAHFRPERQRCAEQLLEQESEVSKVQAIVDSKADCKNIDAAKLRAFVEESEAQLASMRNDAAQRKADIEQTEQRRSDATTKLESRTRQHDVALKALNNMAELLATMEGRQDAAGEVASLLEVASAASADAQALSHMLREAVHADDTKTIEELMVRLRESLHEARGAHAREHEGEVSNWNTVLDMQRSALQTVEGSIEELEARVRAAKERITLAHAGEKSCEEHVAEAEGKLPGIKEQHQATKAGCDSVEDAYKRESARHETTLSIVARIRDLVREKLEALGDYVKASIAETLAQAAATAAAGGPGEEMAQALAGAVAQATQEEAVTSATSATGAVEILGMESSAGPAEEDVNDVPEGALPRMPSLPRESATGVSASTGAAEAAYEAGSADESSRAEVATSATGTADVQAPFDGVVQMATGSAFADQSQCAYSYAGPLGPDTWHKQCNGAWEACDASAPTLQSPIDLRTSAAEMASGPALPVAYHGLAGLALRNTGSALEITGNFGAIRVGHELFQAERIIFHAGSEHTFNGVHSHVEMQIVHTLGSRHVVVAVLLDRAAEGELATAALQTLGITEDTAIPSSAFAQSPISAVRLGEFAREFMGGDYFAYEGSLTVPPCTVQTQWYVVKSHVRVQANLLARIESALQAVAYPALGNTRATQPARERVVRLVHPDTFA